MAKFADVPALRGDVDKRIQHHQGKGDGRAMRNQAEDERPGIYSTREGDVPKSGLQLLRLKCYYEQNQLCYAGKYEMASTYQSVNST